MLQIKTRVTVDPYHPAVVRLRATAEAARRYNEKENIQNERDKLQEGELLQLSLADFLVLFSGDQLDPTLSIELSAAITG